MANTLKPHNLRRTSRRITAFTVVFALQVDIQLRCVSLVAKWIVKVALMLLPMITRAASAAVLIFSAPGLAQSTAIGAPPAAVALQQCRTIIESAARLACYDQAAQRFSSALASGDIAIVERDQIRRARRSLFGFSVADLPFIGEGKEAAPRDKGAPRELVTTLESFSSQGNGRFRFTVTDANALWETTESAPLNDPRRGETVTIKRGALGSFFAQIGKQRWVRARRIR